MRAWEIVPLNEIQIVWEFVGPLVKLACDKSFNKYSPNDFMTLLLKGQAQLWVGKVGGKIEASAITDVINFPNKKYARVTIGMGDDPTNLESFITAFEAWARSVGCHGVQSEMRPGFAPQFSKANWKRTHVLMEKEF